MYVGGIAGFVKIKKSVPKSGSEVWHLQVYRIAGLCLGFEGVQEVPEDSVWRKFASNGKPDVLYRVRYAESLPSVQGQPYFSDARIRRYRTERGEMRIHSDLYTRRDTVAVSENADGSVHELVISMHRHPWGSTAEQLFEVLDLPKILLLHGRLVMHGAYLTAEGRAIIFTAPSGVGKSTQAELWRRHCGAQVINGDRVLLGFENNCLMAYGFPFSGSSDDCENVAAPVACIVSLAQAEQNRLEKMKGREAVKHVLRGVYSENGADFAGQLSFVLHTVQSVPVYRLACVPDESAADILRQRLQIGSRTPL